MQRLAELHDQRIECLTIARRTIFPNMMHIQYIPKSYLVFFKILQLY